MQDKLIMTHTPTEDIFEFTSGKNKTKQYVFELTPIQHSCIVPYGYTMQAPPNPYLGLTLADKKKYVFSGRRRRGCPRLITFVFQVDLRISCVHKQ